jgi:hypothetical protein
VRQGALIGDIAPLKRSGDLRVRIQHSEDENRHGEATQGNKKKLD